MGGGRGPTDGASVPGDSSNSDWRPPPTDQEAVSRLVADALGSQTSIAAWHLLEPWALARLILGGPGPSSLILKWVRSDRQGWQSEPSQVLTEGVALDFVGQLCPGLVPALVGFDPMASLVLMEDLAPRRPLLDLLRDRDRLAPEGLVSFAQALAELHASTVGRAEEYYSRRRQLGPVDPARERRRFFWEPTWKPATIEAQLDVPLSSAAERDVQTAMNLVGETETFMAFSNGDSGANNYLIGTDGGRIIDFEFAGYRCCLSDIACLYVPGPQWMAVADPAADGTEDAYRQGLEAAIPQVGDDNAYGEGIAAAGMLYALMRLGRFEMLNGRYAGHESRTQMVSTLSFAHRTAERFRKLPDLASWLAQLELALRRRWPDADVAVEDIPAYSRRF